MRQVDNSQRDAAAAWMDMHRLSAHTCVTASKSPRLSHTAMRETEPVSSPARCVSTQRSLIAHLNLHLPPQPRPMDRRLRSRGRQIRWRLHDHLRRTPEAPKVSPLVTFDLSATPFPLRASLEHRANSARSGDANALSVNRAFDPASDSRRCLLDHHDDPDSPAI